MRPFMEADGTIVPGIANKAQKYRERVMAALAAGKIS